MIAIGGISGRGVIHCSRGKLDSRELVNELKRCAEGRLPIGDFEEWFAINSWNVHKQQDTRLTEAVFRIEELFSLLNDGHLQASDLLQRLGEVATDCFPPLGHDPFVVWVCNN
jgi:hypothetical protein